MSSRSKLKVLKVLARTFAVAGVAALAAGCAKEDSSSSDTTVSTTESLAEAVTQAVAGESDAQSGSSFAQLRTEKTDKWSNLAALLSPRAEAASCARAVAQSCVSGVRSISQTRCDISGSNLTISGDVTLTYSQSACTMASDADTVTRTYDYTVNGPRGGSIRNFSSNRTNAMLGATIGGGGRLTKTSAGFDLDILGKHKVGTSARGRTLFDVSIKTASPVAITGGLARSGRVLNGGQIDVYHNVAGVKASFVPTNVQYSNTCCHPISGSWAVTYTGNLTGSATLTFSGCGNATLTQGGSTEPVTLSYCE